MSSMTSDEEFMASVPIGYKFRPRDYELLCYLSMKITNDRPMPPNKIHAVYFYDSDPDALAGRYEKANPDSNEWYFFTSRQRKHRNGSRPNRVAGDGNWKANGAEIPIKKNGQEIGTKMVLAYQRTSSKKSTKTDWSMIEFRLKNAQTPKNDMTLDDWVLCKMYKTTSKSALKRRRQEAKESSTKTSLIPNIPLLPCSVPQPLEPVQSGAQFSSPPTPGGCGPYQVGFTSLFDHDIPELMSGSNDISSLLSPPMWSTTIPDPYDQVGITSAGMGTTSQFDDELIGARINRTPMEYDISSLFAPPKVQSSPCRIDHLPIPDDDFAAWMDNNIDFSTKLY